MRLSDIFSLSCFRSPEERKAADLERLDRKLHRLCDGRLETMLEDEMDRADARDRDPAPVKVDMIFSNLRPCDITRDRLEKNGLAFLEFLANDIDARLTVAVTPETIRPLFGAAATGARLSITVDMNRPFTESTIRLSEGDTPHKEPAAPVHRLIP